MTIEKKDLRSRKQELVCNTILEAAIALFEAKGFHETDVAEIAETAGISKRSFFRYFATKDDLLARSVTEYGAVLAEAIRSAPRQSTDLEVIQLTLKAGVHHNERPDSRARQLIAIATSHPTAQQAYLSRKHLVEDAIADAYASRARASKRDDLKVRVLAGITLALMNATIGAWFLGEEETLESAAKHAQAELQRLALNTAKTSSRTTVKTRR